MVSSIWVVDARFPLSEHSAIAYACQLAITASGMASVRRKVTCTLGILFRTYRVGPRLTLRDQFFCAFQVTVL